MSADNNILITPEYIEQTKLDVIKAHPLNWKKQVREILNRFNDLHATYKKPISYKTRANRASVIYAALNEIREGGFKLKNVYNLNAKHIAFLVSQWEERGLSAATLQSNFSHMKCFTRWIGKEGRAIAPLCHNMVTLPTHPDLR